MTSSQKILLFFLCSILLLGSCKPEEEPVADEADGTDNEVVTGTAIEEAFGSQIDMDNLPNYAAQTVPAYIREDNTANNVITNKGAVLGRILFYDKNLSADNTVSCASCHGQATAFSDGDRFSTGVNGSTGRHSMRLINARFGEETRFFWDERAATLEAQTTQPIQDHIEMGFSGEDGDEDIDDLIAKLQEIPYYPELFTEAFGEETITENRMQQALAQFIRSIQSFDSRFDTGLQMTGNVDVDFPNLTAEENEGKRLFLQRGQFNNNGVRIGGGLSCGGCHRAPEFSIDPDSRSNGVTLAADGSATEFNITRAPSLRDIFNPAGELNGLLMHTGDMDMGAVLDHYNNVPGNTQNLDARLNNRGNGQNLQITEAEKAAVIAFMKTLTGSDVYTNNKWSDPFKQ